MTVRRPEIDTRALAKARRRAVARNCAHWLERDRKRKLGASRARWAAWKAQQKERGDV